MDEQKWLLGLLGSFRLERDGQLVVRFRPSKQNLILAYLGTHPLAEQPRSDLAEIFWPDVPLATGLRYLSFTLCMLRDRLRKLGLLDAVYTSPSTLQLNPHIATDVQLFQQHLLAASTQDTPRARAAQLKQALANYGGELLATVHAPWVERERERLAKLYEHALGELADLLQPGADLKELARHVPPSAWIAPTQQPYAPPESAISTPELAEELGPPPSPAVPDREELRSFAREAARGLAGPDRSLWLDRLRERGATIRAALDEQAASPDTAFGLDLAGVLLHYWLLTDAIDQGRWYLEKLLEQPSTASLEVRATALHAAGTLAYKAGDLDLATQRFDQAIPIWHELGDHAGLLRTMANRATVSYGAADFEAAQEHYRRCVCDARRFGDEKSLVKLLLNAALTEIRLGSPGPAGDLLGERLALVEELGDTRGVATTRLHLAGVALMEGRADDARTDAEGAMDLLDEARDPALSSLGHRILGRIEHQAGNYEGAFARFHDSLQLAKESGDVREMAETMRYLALTFHATGHSRRAAALCRQAIGLLEAVGDHYRAAKATDALEQIEGGRGG